MSRLNSEYYSHAGSIDSRFQDTYSHKKGYIDNYGREKMEPREPKAPKRIRDVTDKFMENTSLHTMAFIHLSHKWYSTAIWVCILLVATGMWIAHSFVLIKSYTKFETSSKVSITFDDLDFPTITICNINPIRESLVRVYGGQYLPSVLSLLAPEQAYGMRRRKKRQAEEDYDLFELYDSRLADLDVFGDVNFTNYYYVGDFADVLAEDVSNTVIARRLVEELLVELPDANRTRMGHLMNHMLLDCTYDHKSCSNRNFHRYLDVSYGNCYSFNSKFIANESYVSSDSGANYGLDLLLYIQNVDYIRGIQQGRGARLYIHDFGTQPFVEDSGISVPTGFQTYIALRQVKQKRLGGKYGECDDGGAYEKYYGGDFTYTLDACLRTCEDRSISEKCRCYINAREQFYNAHDRATLRPCKSADDECTEAIENDFTSFNLDCNCNQACSSTDYEFVISQDQWPDDSLWFSLISAVCDEVSDEECDRLQFVPETDRETFLQKNFLHLKIYYRNLNIETIEETPAYEDIQFYSDFGGALGLWLGASVITVLEVGDMIVRCIQYGCKRKEYRRRKDRQRIQHNGFGQSQSGSGRHDNGRHGHHTSVASVLDSPRLTGRESPRIRDNFSTSRHSHERSTHALPR